MLAAPVWFWSSAARPTAVLELPVVLLISAVVPLAVSLIAFGVVKQSQRSIGVLLLPVSLNSSAAVPLAVFSVPVVSNKSAAAPVAVFESAV